jgi:hypothetical protein
MNLSRPSFRMSIFFAALLLAFLPLRADDVASTPAAAAPVTDPAVVAQGLRQTLTRPEFQEAAESGVSPRIEDVLSQWFKRLGAKVGQFKYTSSMPAFESLLMSLLVTLSLGILFYIIFRLTRRRSWTWREADVVPSGEKLFRSPEFYDNEIDQAVRARDWHAAWLAAWRQFLSRLEHRSLVEADRTRTNREYLGQLSGKPLPSTALALLTTMVDAYDRFIYGRGSIGENDWRHFHQQIEEAALLLHLDDKRASAPAGRAAA